MPGTGAGGCGRKPQAGTARHGANACRSTLVLPFTH